MSKLFSALGTSAGQEPFIDDLTQAHPKLVMWSSFSNHQFVYLDYFELIL